jgi:hypothetical protein
VSDEFYVGYAAKAPEGVARTTRRAVTGLAAVAIGACALLIKAQQPFARATFEYQQPREFAGVVETDPYPALLVPRPNGAGAYSRYLLVAPGKHGPDVAAFRGREVALSGSLIYRGAQTMIELVPGSVKTRLDVTPTPQPAASPADQVKVTGEIVDSKCYLGVMNPGRTKIHRDCAARCLRGGIPAFLVTADTTYLLKGLEYTDFIGETVEVEGSLERAGENWILRARKITTLE